jgi:hypothetical protein
MQIIHFITILLYFIWTIFSIRYLIINREIKFNFESIDLLTFVWCVINGVTFLTLLALVLSK